MNALDQTHMHPSARAALKQDTRDLLRLAMALQGTDALICSREHAARHEAGHAVAYRDAGRRLLSVEVFRRGEDWLGYTRAAGPNWKVGPDTDPSADLIEVGILLAGPLAELTTSQKPALGAGLDEISLARSIVATAAHKIGADPSVVMLEMISATLDMLALNRKTLDALSSTLMKHRKLKGLELARVLRVAGAAKR